MIKLSDYVANRLKRIYGIETIFMISGGGAMHLNDSFGKYIDYICNHHEQASAIAAEGYARVNQKLAIVNITTGPGGLNCLNGVFGQWTDSVPVLYISGQVKTNTMMDSCKKIPLRQLGDQEVDIINIVKPIVKYAKTITDPNEISYILDKAIFLATHGRKGPVWIDIPVDIQSAMIDENNLKIYDTSEDDLVLENKQVEAQVKELVSLIEKAKKPLIIAGYGIRLSESKEYFQDLINKLQIPTATTFNGMDLLPSNHPLFIGRIGTVGNRAANMLLQSADLVISIGSRNNIRQVSYNWENFAKNAKLILVDIDKAELEKPTLKPYMKILSDCRIFLEKLNNNSNNTKPKIEWIRDCKTTIEKYPLFEFSKVTGKGLEPYSFIHNLTKEFNDDEIIITANGSAVVVTFQAGIVKENQRYIWNSGDASMGYDLPAAIGASIANNKKRVICVAGDGSIMMNLQELHTIKHYDLPIKIFVLNNNGYNSIKQTQNNFFEGRETACNPTSGVSMPNFLKVAESFGIKSVKIENENGLDDKIKDVLNCEGPVLCEVVLNQNYIFTPKLSSKKLEDGTIVSPSLEDMYPFIEH